MRYGRDAVRAGSHRAAARARTYTARSFAIRLVQSASARATASSADRATRIAASTSHAPRLTKRFPRRSANAISASVPYPPPPDRDELLGGARQDRVARLAESGRDRDADVRVGVLGIGGREEPDHQPAGLRRAA
jgi:hypothetical protein